MSDTKSRTTQRRRTRTLHDVKQVLQDLRDVNRFESGVLDRLERAVEQLQALHAADSRSRA